MRARNLKPSLFKNELLATSDPIYAWVFEGLWCLADREGRLEDRPRRIHLEINAGRAYETTEGALNWLAENGFIIRYDRENDHFIQIVKFGKHQNPHHREPPSTIPAPGQPQASPGLAPDEPHPSRALSPFPLPDSPSPVAQGACVVAEVSERRRSQERGCRIPEPFPITEDMRAWAKVNCSHVLDVDGATEEFVDYWRGVSGRYAVKTDWIGTWRNRMRELEKRAGRTNGRQKPERSEWL